MNTNDSPATRLRLRRKRVAREGEHEQRRARLATRAASSSARRNSAPERARFQMPCAITGSKLRSRAGRPPSAPESREIGRQRVPLVHGSRRRHKAWATTGRCRPRSAPARERHRVASGAAADIEHACAGRPFQLLSANDMRTAFGADRANPATVPGALQCDPASGSISET